MDVSMRTATEVNGELLFFCNGKKIIDRDVDPEMTLLSYLLIKPLEVRLTGSKLGCNEGGCGACTVMISYYDVTTKLIRHLSVNACLTPICSVHGMAVTTVEGIGNTKTKLHPVQERIAKAHGTQCGFCTPGIVMSMYTLLRNNPQPTMQDISSSLEGNLCRCTGYRPILEGFKTFTKDGCCGKGKGWCCQGTSNNYTEGVANALFDPSEFIPYDPSQDVIFPPELIIFKDLHETAFRYKDIRTALQRNVLLDYKNINPMLSQSVTFTGERVTWYCPVSLDELLAIKASQPSAKIVVGNTEVGIEVKFKNQLYSTLVSATHILDLQVLEITKEGINIGAAVTLTRLKEFLKVVIDKEEDYKTRVFSAILEMLRWFAGSQIRNVAAVGGNIVTGSPISDLNPLFMAAGSKLELASHKGRRQVLMNQNFFVGYRRTVIKQEEVLVSIHIPFSRKNEYFSGYKQSPRREDDIAIVNAGMRVRFEPGTNKVEECSLAFGGMAATTVMATKTVNAIAGRKWDDNLVSDVCSSLDDEIQLTAGAPGGMETYRQSLMLSFFYKFYLNVLSELNKHLEESESIPATERSGCRDIQRNEVNGTQIYQEVPLGQPSEDAVGRPNMHKSAFKHTTGEALYCDDIPKMEGELYMGVVPSSKAFAKIVSVDPSVALSVPGVHGYVTADDVPGSNVTGFAEDEQIFCTEQVNCVGQMLGGIVADSKAIAQRAAKMVKIEYEEMEPIITLEDAIQKDSYIKPLKTISKGCLEEGFEASDHIIHGEMRLTGGQEHFYLETQACLVVPKEDEGEMEIFCATQAAEHVQSVVAKSLGVSSNKIVCRVKRLGGGFGGKETPCLSLTSAVAVAAKRFNRPVRLMLERNEDMSMTGTRHPFLGRYKVGFTDEGILKALEIDLFSNCGYSQDYSQIVMVKAMFHCSNAYRVPNLTVRPHMMKTNLPSNTAMRGLGVAQAIIIAENWISDVALKCSISQRKVRELNLYKEGDKTHFNQTLDNCHMWKCWEECVNKSDYVNRRQQVDNYNRSNRWKKRGLAIVPTCFGISFVAKYMTQAGALVHIYTDGSVLLSHGGVEMGQGLHTKMIQVASRALRIPSDRIFTNEMSTSTVPNTTVTAASVGSDLNGMAVKNACEILRERLEPYMYENPKASWEDWVQAAYYDRVSLSTTGFYRTPDLGYDSVTNSDNKYHYFSYGTAVSEVEIDCLTGGHQVLRTDIVMDVGDSLNPAIDIGQVEGAFVQGYGLYVLEDHRWSPDGHLLTKGPGTYKIPGFGDIPAEFNVSFLRDVPNQKAVYSSKGIGEPPLVLATSVFFAIKDAIQSARYDARITGIFRLDAPATADRIRMACVDQFTKQFEEPKPGTYVPFFVRP